MIGRPETHPVKKIIGFSDDMITALEKWRAKQKPSPNLSEAIRQLVEIGLTVKTTGKRNPTQKARAKELAGGAIDKLTDAKAAPADQASRKTRLLKGPEEFRETRANRSKPKR